MSSSRKVFGFVWRAGICMALAAFFVFVRTPKAGATNPGLINFQGKVVNADGTNVANGTYSFDFVMYDDSSLGTPSDGVHDKWHELSKSVTVTNGVFQTNLGSATSLPDFNANPSLYLAIKFNGDSAGYMTPRVQMTSAPYALNADKLGGLTSSAFGQLNAINAWTNTNGITVSSATAFQVSNSSGQILTVDTSANKVLLGKPGASGITGTLVFNNATNSNTVTFQSGTTSSSYTLTLPTALPGSTQCIASSNAGALSFTACSGGGGSGTLATDYTNGTAQTDSTITLDTTRLGIIIKDASSPISGSLLTVQNNGGTTKYLDIRSNGLDILGAGASTITTSSGNLTIQAGSGTVSLGTSTTLSAAAGLSITTTGANVLTLATGGAAGVLVNPGSNTSSALSVQNTGGQQVFTVSTSGGNTTNLIGNSSVESAISAVAGNWQAKGSATTTKDSTQSYIGSSSLKIATTAAANDGAKQQLATTLTTSTRYLASFYVRLDQSSAFTSSAAAGMTTFAAGYSSTGASDDTACTLNTSSIIPHGWTKITCSFTTPGTTNSSNYFYVKQTDAKAYTWYVDAVLMQQDTTSNDNNYREGSATIQGVVVSPLIIQNTANSSNGLLVQNASGTNIFAVDTTDSNIVSNPGFEVNTNGWAAEQGTGTISRDTSQSWVGFSSLNITTSSTANAGAKFTTGNTQPTQLALSSSYTLSWYAKLSSGTLTDIKGRYSPDGGTTFVECTPTSQTVSTAGWTRFTCTFNTGATAVTSGAYIAIVQTATGTARTFWIDGVQLEGGSTATPYGAGGLTLNGTINTPLSLRNAANSTTALQVSNASGLGLITVDTLNNSLTIGTGSGLGGKVSFSNATNNNTVSFQAGTTSSSYTWTLPTADAAGCLQSNGSGTLSIAACGDTKKDVVTATSTWTKPTNAQLVIVETWGSGGGGGGGTGGTTAAVRSGGGGGGGGAYNTTNLAATDLGATVEVTVGTGGTAGTAGSSAVGGNGGAGNPSCFSTTTACAGTIYLRAFGGGFGAGTGTAGNGGGGGGGTQAVGSNASAATGGGGGGPLGAAAGASNSGSGGGGGVTAAATPAAAGAANFGGGGGGGTTTAGAGTAGVGGLSVRGGGGGGAGGDCAITTCTNRAGGTGGAATGGATTGGTSGTAGGGAGGAGNSGIGYGGSGGGGGGSNSAGTGGAGGTGGIPGGGGGGGAAGETTTGGAGAAGGRGEVHIWTLRGSGADLAEMYCTNDTSLSPGDTVSLDPNLRAGVKKTQQQYDGTAIGTISTSPGLVTGLVEEQCAKPVLVALAGRVPVKVNLENGPIRKGDLLAASSTPGEAMRATKAGTIIGQAMTAYDGTMPDGYVVAFVKSSQTVGSKLGDVLPGLESTQPTETLTLQQKALDYFLSLKEQLASSVNLSEVTTDRVSAGLEVISPSLVADTVSANTIKPAKGSDVIIAPGSNGKIIIKDTAGNTKTTLDSLGNANFALDVTAGGLLKANGGLQVNGAAEFAADTNFKKLVSFLETVTFQKEVSLLGRPTFNNDTAGFALIKAGQSSVNVSFDKPYDTQPAVTLGVKNGQFVNYAYTYLLDEHQKVTGFTILLKQPSNTDTEFAWTALNIKDAKTAGSP